MQTRLFKTIFALKGDATWIVYRVPNKEDYTDEDRQRLGIIIIEDDNTPYYNFSGTTLSLKTTKRIMDVLTKLSLVNRKNPDLNITTGSVLSIVEDGDRLCETELCVRPYEEPVIDITSRYSSKQDRERHILLDLPIVMALFYKMKDINDNFAYNNDGQFTLYKNKEQNRLEISCKFDEENTAVIAYTQDLSKVKDIKSDLRIEYQYTCNGRLIQISESILNDFKMLDGMHDSIIKRQRPWSFYAKPCLHNEEGVITTLSSFYYNDWMPIETLNTAIEFLSRQ